MEKYYVLVDRNNKFLGFINETQHINGFDDKDIIQTTFYVDIKGFIIPTPNPTLEEIKDAEYFLKSAKDKLRLLQEKLNEDIEAITIAIDRINT